LPIGLHGGLIWSYYLVKVGQLFQYTNRVPEWVTGIDGNPLSGIMGLCFMTVLMLALRQLALTKT
ncbi:MAG TPA: CPBP family intramembrane glutamate endopeptidase, partial [Coleofasciculaceae cyanobacterium]